MQTIPKIIVVGGGAGGLELVTALGHSMGKSKKADILLVDQALTHMWKPLLHEVAAGTLNNFADEVNFINHANANYYRFQLGKLASLNRKQKQISLTNPIDSNQQQLTLDYDILVLAFGSMSNNFNTPGADQYCYYLDNVDQAKKVHQHFLKQMIDAQFNQEDKPFEIVIVGGGATGVELSAELHTAIEQVTNLNLYKNGNKPQTKITLIEAAPRLLAQLPERVSDLTAQQLQALDIAIMTNQHVSKIQEDGLHTTDGKFISANVVFWAAGIKGKPVASTLDGLEVTKTQQLLVKPNLLTTIDDSIFAFGDCAACPQANSDRFVPARAQAAHQQASLLVKSIKNKLNHKSLHHFQYRDRGSLISLSHKSTVGQLMGKFHKGLMIDGWLARMFYLSLYKMHQAKLFGWFRVSLMTMANFLTRRVRSRLKLH